MCSLLLRICSHHTDHSAVRCVSPPLYKVSNPIAKAPLPTDTTTEHTPEVADRSLTSSSLCKLQSVNPTHKRSPMTAGVDAVPLVEEGVSSSILPGKLM